MKGAAALHEGLADAHDDGGVGLVDLPICGPIRVARVAVPEGRVGGSPAGLNAKAQALADALRGFRAFLLGHDPFDGRQEVAVAVELHERAVAVGPHLDAGVLELHEQRSLPRGVAREAIEVAQDEHVEGAALGAQKQGLKLRPAHNLCAALVVVDEDAIGGEVPGLRLDCAFGVLLLHQARLDSRAGPLPIFLAQSNVNRGSHVRILLCGVP